MFCRNLQVVQLDYKLRLLDSPCTLFASSQGGAHSEAVVALRNAVQTDSLSDPIILATAVQQRVNKQQVFINITRQLGSFCAKASILSGPW
jgi:ribosome biogenesis GTPase A